MARCKGVSVLAIALGHPCAVQPLRLQAWVGFRRVLYMVALRAQLCCCGMERRKVQVGVPMHFHHRGIHHRILHVRLLTHCIEQALEYVGLDPIPKALEHRIPFVKLFR